MSIRAVLLVLAALVACSNGADVKYSTLVAGGHVVDMKIALSYTDKETTTEMEYNAGKPCLADDKSCQTPTFSSDDDSKLFLTLTVPKKLDTLKTFDGSALTPPKTLTVKLCYEKSWTKDRKWRKIKDVINDDKRCKNKVIKKFKLSEAKDGVIKEEMPYVLPTDISKAQWFFTAYLNCDVEGKEDDTAVCAVDTTGTLGAIAKAADVQKALGDGATEDQAKKLLAETKTSQQIHIATDVRESRPAGLYVACIIMSVISVSMLFGFFIFEHLTKKNK